MFHRNVPDQGAAGPSNQSHNSSESESHDILLLHRSIALGLRDRVTEWPDMRAMPKQTRDVSPAYTKKRTLEIVSSKTLGKRKASESVIVSSWSLVAATL